MQRFLPNGKTRLFEEGSHIDVVHVRIAAFARLGEPYGDPFRGDSRLDGFHGEGLPLVRKGEDL